MRLRIDHGRRPSDAYRFADQPAPAAASADAIRVEAIAALERKQGIARIAAKCAIQRPCGKSQGVERILKHEDIYAAASASQGRIAGAAGRGAISFVYMDPGRRQALGLHIAPYSEAVGGPPQAVTLAAAQGLPAV